jgi:predicted nucleotidyltransferase
MHRDHILTRLKNHQPQLQNLGVRSLELFGSVARDRATASSDIDILIELDPESGFFEFFRIQHYLEDLLDRPIDLGTADALREHLRQPVLDEAIHVF